MIIGILRTANTSRTTHVKEERNVHSYNPKRIDLPVQRKTVRTIEGNGCNCEYCKSLSEDYLREALTVRNFHEQPLESRGKPRANQTIPNAHARHHCAKTKLPSEKRNIKFSCHHLERARLRDKFPSLNVIQTSSKNGRSPNAPLHDQICTDWNEEQEEFARHGANKLHRDLFKTKGHHKDVDKTNFFRCYVPAQAENTATGLAIHSRERMYIVDSGAWLQMM